MKKVALVTGGTRGIGLGIAEALANEGYNLAVNGVRDYSLAAGSIEKLKKTGNEVIYCQGNIGNEEDRKKIIDEIQNHYGKLHVLVNNAGVAPKQRADLLEMTAESYRHVMKTNLEGPFFLTQAVANWMIHQQKQDKTFEGMIINITSISATVVSINRGEYCMSKAGMGMMTQLFAVRLADHGIPVYEIRPGIVSTDMTSGVREKYDKLIAEGLTVQKRWGYPEDIGKIVSALISQKLPYSTGQVIMADGGLTIQRL